MSVTLTDVRHVAALARVGLSDERAASLVAELNTILRHMDVLSSVDTTGVDADAASMPPGPVPPRVDAGPSIPLERPREAFAPRMRDGFFLVPRLDTHEDAEVES